MTLIDLISATNDTFYQQMTRGFRGCCLLLRPAGASLTISWDADLQEEGRPF